MNSQDFNTFAKNFNVWSQEFPKAVEKAISKQNKSKNRNSIMWICTAFFGWLAFFGLLWYAIDVEAFKSNISQNITLEPEITSSTLNNYAFDPKTYNNYSMPIVINIPENFCNCEGTGGNSS